jgi:hypothetical protein
LKNKKINPHKLDNWVYDNEVPEYWFFSIFCL